LEIASLKGDTANDSFTVSGGKVVTKTNHNGGINGGISNGMPITFRVAIKPTPSIAIEQETVDLQTMQPCKIQITGRHDACIAPRAVACIEAIAAIALYDLI
jgi:chorismate synthase